MKLKIIALLLLCGLLTTSCFIRFSYTHPGYRYTPPSQVLRTNATLEIDQYVGYDRNEFFQASPRLYQVERYLARNRFNYSIQYYRHDGRFVYLRVSGYNRNALYWLDRAYYWCRIVEISP